MRHTITSPLLCYQAKCPSPGSPSLPNTGCLPYPDGSSKGWYDRLSEYASGPNSLFPSHSPPSPTSRRESKPPLSLSFRAQNRPGSNWQTHMNDLPCRPSCSCSSLPSTPYSSQPPATSTTDFERRHTPATPTPIISGSIGFCLGVVRYLFCVSLFYPLRFTHNATGTSDENTFISRSTEVKTPRESVLATRGTALNPEVKQYISVLSTIIWGIAFLDHPKRLL